MFLKKCVVAWGLAVFLTGAWADVVTDNVDWGAFLKRQDLVWEKLPERFDHGIYHGNGLLGLMIFQDQPNQFRWELGRSDVTAHRRERATGNYKHQTASKARTNAAD
ncbi:MAG: hypothetical protein HN341_14790 [Verrucomicrobia bacterium]|jgi:hypothetical protein|nr:hypothetical protein [Verrucomicrobiota bacterium]